MKETKGYEVTWSETTYYQLFVEASTPEEARTIAINERRDEGRWVASGGIDDVGVDEVVRVEMTADDAAGMQADAEYDQMQEKN